MRSNVETGFLLDRQWHLLRGEMQTTKKAALLALGRVFAEADIPYALIGGIAVQVHARDPRTTIDIDLAVLDRTSIPAPELEAAGFRRTGIHPHTENWMGPDETPVQITDDPEFGDAISRAGQLVVEDVMLRVIARPDLLHAKLRAGADPAPGRSKRLQDLADAHELLEEDPALAGELTATERALLDGLPR